MKKLESLGFTVRTSVPAGSHERRVQVYLLSTGNLVAWFQSNIRLSDGIRVVGTSTQLVDAAGLTAQQLQAILQWLRGEAHAAYTLQ